MSSQVLSSPKVFNARSSALLIDWALVLFDQELLAEGGQLEDSASFVKRLNLLLAQMS